MPICGMCNRKIAKSDKYVYSHFTKVYYHLPENPKCIPKKESKQSQT